VTRSRVLVVEDDPKTRSTLVLYLEHAGFLVTEAADGPAALAVAAQERPDLVVLDRMLPGLDGLEVCRRLRADARTQHIPIVMLTAKGEESDAVIGLAHGADDYVRKPFGMKELLARIATRLRSADGKGASDAQKVLRFGDLVIDSVKHEVSLAGTPIQMTVTEFKLLRHLVQNKGRAFTRNELLNAVLGQDAYVIDRNVDVHVATLRKKLGAFGANIVTLRGLGYKFRESPAPVE
jgi:two-component system phosphate regulon response regulator PhoB